MVELSQEECHILHKRVLDKFSSSLKDKEDSVKLQIADIAARIVITTLREYELMKEELN